MNFNWNFVFGFIKCLIEMKLNILQLSLMGVENVAGVYSCICTYMYVCIHTDNHACTVADKVANVCHRV